MINKRLIGMVPEFKRFMALKTFMSWVSLLGGIVLWFQVAQVLEKALRNETGIEALLLHFIIAALCIGIRFFMTRLSVWLTHRLTGTVKRRLRDAVYSKTQRLGGNYKNEFSTAEIVQLSGEGVEQLETYFGSYLPQFLYAFLAPLTLLVVFLPLSPLTAIALFLCVPLIPVAIVAVQRIAKRLLGKYWDAYAGLGDSFLENLQGLTTLKVYSADQQRHEAMNREAEHFRVVTMKVLTMQLNSVTIMDLVACGGTALGGILTVWTYMNGQLALGDGVAMILLASEFFLAMRTLGSFFHVAMNGMAASDRMFRLLDLPEQEEGKEVLQNGDITLRDLSYSYDGEKQALTGVNLTIKKGSLVSVVGKSGCGKSTMAALLSGMRKDYQGEITVGGTGLHEAAADSLRRLITVVSADSYIFAGSVRETLLEGKADATVAEMLQALRQVRLLDFIQSEGGLMMKLSERGANLSGGQRQRLALARSLLKDSPVYIFDEATSNIDAESEESIMQAIHSLGRTHTVLLISHRLFNVLRSDRIAYLENGQLKEQGSHRELMQVDGGYAALFRAQQALEHLGEGEPVCAGTV